MKAAVSLKAAGFRRKGAMAIVADLLAALLTVGGWVAATWAALEGDGFAASVCLAFPSRVTGVRGFHTWCGGVAGGVRPMEGKDAGSKDTENAESQDSLGPVPRITTPQNRCSSVATETQQCPHEF